MQKICLDNTSSAYSRSTYAIAEYILTRISLSHHDKRIEKLNAFKLVVDEPIIFDVLEEQKVVTDNIEISLVKFVDDHGNMWWSTNFHILM